MAQSTMDVRRAKKQKIVKISSFRPDIQGLRALAVIAVILDHMLGYPSGGFVGVDVFFVLSGFLITGLMLREHQKTGRISFVDFYRRRVRRIMPVAVLVLIVTTAVSWFLFFGERTKSIAWDAFWSAVFAANWRFAALGTDYLQADGPASPLQHYWSLSVEEQFYVVWPALLVLILGFLATKLSWSQTRARRFLGVVFAVVVAASFAFAIWETTNNPTVAYFSTFSRAWELGIGALAAILVPVLAKIPAALRPVMQWAGLVGIFVSLFVVTPQTAFPAPGAALPVLATVLVVAGGVGGQSFMAPLTNPVSRYIGDISYSLYLWHFPVIILLGAVLPIREPVVALSAAGLMLLLSAASYHLVEDPIRKSQWLEPKSKRSRKGGSAPLYTQNARVIAIASLAVLSLGVAGVALIKASPQGPAPVSAKPVMQSDATPAPLPSDSTADAAWAQKVSAALQATDWPTALTPSPDQLGAKGFEKVDSEGCAPATPKGKDCSIAPGDHTKVAVVVGDSMAVAWLPAIKAVLEPKGWSVKSLTYVGCPFIAADTVASDQSITDSCPAHKELVSGIIRDAKPGLVIMGNAYNQALATGTSGQASVPAWEAALTESVKAWTVGAGHVVTLQSPPTAADPKACITKISHPRDCVSPVSSMWLAYSDADQRVAKALGSTFVETRSLFCNTAADCPAFIDNTIVRRDATHITVDFATKVAPLLVPKFAAVTG